MYPLPFCAVAPARSNASACRRVAAMAKHGGTPLIPLGAGQRESCISSFTRDRVKEIIFL